VKAFMNRRFALALLALALVAADLLRPSLEPGIPVFQATLVAVTVAVLWSFFLRERQAAGERWALLALVVLCSLLYLRHPRSLDADGYHYFTFARSLIFDRDLDLSNDYALLGHEMGAKNVLPIGAPLVWSLFLAPLALVSSLVGVVPGVEVTGAEPMFIAAACLVSIAFGSVGLFLLYRELRRFAGPLASLLAVLLVWFGSPLRFYMRVLPSFAHAIEFLAGVLVLIAARRLHGQGSAARAFRAGLACGLVYLVRSQDGLLLLVPAIFIFDAWLGHRSVRRMVGEGAAALAGFASLAWIQSAVWWSMFGTPFLVPHKTLHGEAFAAGAAPKLLEMLLSDRGGLFSTYPVMLLAVLGLPFALRKCRPWVVAGLVVLGLQWWVNASIFDWYQVRRFTGTVPLLALGLVVLTPALARAGALVCALLVVLVHQYDVSIDSLRPYPGSPAPVQKALHATFDSFAASIYLGLEQVSPRVGVSFLEGYTGSTLLRTGRSDLDFAREDWWTRLPRPSRRFSEVEPEDGSLARFVEGREGQLWLPLRGRGELRLSLEIRAMETEQPQAVEVLVNGVSLGRHGIAPSWQTVRFVLPETVWREGSNEIVLKFEHAVNFFQVRGYGARAYRSAAIRKITLHRDDP
jgi:hypothetical protein